MPESGHLDLFGVPVWLLVFASLAALHATGTYLLKRGVVLAASPLAEDPVLAGHFLPQLCGFIVLAVYGTQVWLTSAAEVPPVDEYFAEGEVLVAIMVGFQMYELAATVPSKRLRGNAYEMVIHHCITLLLAWLGYTYQVFLYFGAFFFGLSEVSSLPLALVDLFKVFPALRQDYPTVNEVVRVLFAVTFLAIRGIYWPFVSFFFWKSSLATLAAEAFEPRIVIYIFFGANVVLTLMQWYWAFLVLSALAKKCEGTPPKDDAEADAAADYELHQPLAGKLGGPSP